MEVRPISGTEYQPEKLQTENTPRPGQASEIPEQVQPQPPESERLHLDVYA
jgi:hypothetical protein